MHYLPNKTIWKFPLALEEEIVLKVPVGGITRHFGLDPQSEFAVWIEVDRTALRIDRKYAIVGTGHNLPNLYTYFGTLIEGKFVWHLYEFDYHAEQMRNGA